MYRVLAALVSDYLSIISLPLISVFWGVVADTGQRHIIIYRTHIVEEYRPTRIFIRFIDFLLFLVLGPKIRENAHQLEEGLNVGKTDEL